MEPTRQGACAIMSLRRAAHLKRWADNEHDHNGTYRSFL
jgi:hypothetical protein